MTMRCNQCKWWWISELDDPDDIVGLCRRFPPRPMLENDGSAAPGAFPQTWRDDWCGEFTEKKAELVDG